jgi:uncharacterized protein
MNRKRKIPLRICVGCQERKPKKELVRIVRTPDGETALDLTGKKPGRGAYICPSQGCLKSAVKGKRLEKHLQIKVSPELIEQVSVLLAENFAEDR